MKALTLGDLVEIVVEATPEIEGGVTSPERVPEYVFAIVNDFPPNIENGPIEGPGDTPDGQTAMLVAFLARIAPLGAPVAFGFDARTMIEEATGKPCPFYSDWRWSESEGWVVA